MAVRNRFAEMSGEIAGWRRHLHSNPELMFDTFETAEFVASKLRELGCDEVATGIGRTGVVGVIKGRADSSGRAIGLRADMDALPIREETGLEYASKNDRAMHACGHDGHTSMLLGAAKYLSETRNFDGSVALIFQPAEEGGAGGKEMVDDGMMERFGISEVYGMHNMPGLPIDRFAIRSGPFLAAADQFTVTISGKGGHAARPQFARDTTLAAAHAVVALQSIVSRNADPLRSLVVSVTSFQTDSDTHNVLPQRAVLKGTVRTLDAETQDMAEARIGEVAKSTAAAYGATAEVDFARGYPITTNSDSETEFAARAAASVTGNVDRDAAVLMASEDFAFMLNARPGAFILIGNGDTAPVHHPEYDFNDEIIPAGCSYWVELAESRLAAA